MTNEEIIAKATEVIKKLKPYEDGRCVSIPVSEIKELDWISIHLVTFRQEKYRQDSRQWFEWEFHRLDRGK